MSLPVRYFLYILLSVFFFFPSGVVAAPDISDVTVSDVSHDSVKISWTTSEESTTQVDYGLDTEYGSTVSDATLTMSHSITLTGLTANSTYHFNAHSENADSEVGDSGDNTFLTAVQSSSSSSTSTSSTTVTPTGTPAPTPTPTPVPDTVGPSVSLVTSIEKPFTQAPAIKGVAADKSNVSSLEYSVDGGRNFLPVDFIDKPNTIRTDFTFTPQLLDGNYELVMRAKDGKGNTSTAQGGTLIVDRLPPRIGGVIFSLGPQELAPSGDGSFVFTAGLDYKITLSSVGGPLSMDIQYRDKGGELRKTGLKKNLDNGLWNGYIRFTNPGMYAISVISVDGADNAIDKELARVVVLESGYVTDGKVPVTNGKVEVYYLDDGTKRFVLWDGKAYGQVNPQQLTADGGYRLYIPSGTYYIRVTAPGYKTLVTSIFTTSKPHPLVVKFVLTHARAIQIGLWLIPLPDFTQTTTTIDIEAQHATGSTAPKILSQEFPYFRLGAEGNIVTATSFRGKPTLITFLNTWLPQATAQLAVLDELAKKSEMYVVVIVPHETASSVSIFKKRAAYTLSIVADPDGDLIEATDLHTFPAHIVVDRKGIVKSIQTGLYDKEELLDMIVQ